MLIEIRWHGRGGQGAVTASNLLAKAASYENLWAQSMVFFGAERRGAHVFAYTRISDNVIKYHHYVHKPDYVIVLSPQLIDQYNVTSGLKENGTIIINYSGDKSKIKERYNSKWKIAVVDATQIAIDLDLLVAGIPVVNTIMLGAFSKVSGVPKIEFVEKAIREFWTGEIAEKNVKGAVEAYKKVNII